MSTPTVRDDTTRESHRPGSLRDQLLHTGVSLVEGVGLAAVRPRAPYDHVEDRSTLLADVGLTPQELATRIRALLEDLRRDRGPAPDQ